MYAFEIAAEAFEYFMLFCVGGVVDEFLHAAGGEEIHYCASLPGVAHAFDGDDAFGVVGLCLGTGFLLSALFLCRLFSWRLFLFGLLWRDVIVAADGFFSGLGRDGFGLISLQFFGIEFIEDEF